MMINKLEKLVNILNLKKSLVIAFSGGVDSSFLTAVAKNICDINVVAVTIVTEFQSEKEYNHSVYMGRRIGVDHAFINVKLLKNKNITINNKNRCYFCKKALFTALINYAGIIGITNIAHGANTDDLNDFRPGFEAAREMHILSPLIDAGLDKKMIRIYSEKMGLDTWNMPSQSCLATRIQYNNLISSKNLAMVEKSETYLESLGFDNIRVRCHGKMARIELEPEFIGKIADKSLRKKIIDKFKEIGFSYISVDLEGYIQGSMNRY